VKITVTNVSNLKLGFSFRFMLSKKKNTKKQVEIQLTAEVPQLSHTRVYIFYRLAGMKHVYKSK